MSAQMVVQDIIRAAKICAAQCPAAGLSRSDWIVGGVTRSLTHARGCAYAHDSVGFAALVSRYLEALRAAGEHEAAGTVAAKFGACE